MIFGANYFGNVRLERSFRRVRPLRSPVVGRDMTEAKCATVTPPQQKSNVTLPDYSVVRNGDPGIVQIPALLGGRSVDNS